MAMTLEEKRQRRAEQKQSQLRMERARAEASLAITENLCPECGQHVHRNLALAGWIQCDGFGAEGFRKDPNASPCNWQGFTGE